MIVTKIIVISSVSVLMVVGLFVLGHLLDRSGKPTTAPGSREDKA